MNFKYFLFVAWDRYCRKVCIFMCNRRYNIESPLAKPNVLRNKWSYIPLISECAPPPYDAVRGLVPCGYGWAQPPPTPHPHTYNINHLETIVIQTVQSLQTCVIDMIKRYGQTNRGVLDNTHGSDATPHGKSSASICATIQTNTHFQSFTFRHSLQNPPTLDQVFLPLLDEGRFLPFSLRSAHAPGQRYVAPNMLWHVVCTQRRIKTTVSSGTFV